MTRAFRHYIQRRRQGRSRHSPVQQRETPKESDVALSNGLRQYQLRVNMPNDAYEVEADTMARQVTQMPAGAVQRDLGSSGPELSLAQQVTPLIQRDDMEKDDKKLVPAKEMPGEKVMKKEEQQAAKEAAAPEPMKKDDEMAQAQAIQRQGPLEDDEMVTPADAIQRQAGAKDDKKLPPVKNVPDQKKKEDAVQMSGKGATVTPGMEERVMVLQQSGRPLSVTERAYYEARFGADLSGVRVHDDAETAHIARGLNAHAFTQGQHIFFGSGEYRQDDTPGRALLAHELTHTLQQGGVTATSRQSNALSAPLQRAEERQGESDRVGLDTTAPHLELGVGLPVQDHKNDPFAISLDEVQFTAPSKG